MSKLKNIDHSVGSYQFDFQEMQWKGPGDLFTRPLIEEDNILRGFDGGRNWGTFSKDIQEAYKKWKHDEFERQVFGPVYPERYKP